MSYDLSVKRAPRYMRVTVTGTPTIDLLLSLIHLLGVESATWDRDAVLVDLRGVETLYTPQEQFRIGEEAAASLGHLRKIASVVPTHRVTRISEKAARRSGTNIQVFDSAQEALSWLHAD